MIMIGLYKMPDNLQRRHQLIFDCLTKQAPKRLTAQQIAKITGLSAKTVSNEMPYLLNMKPEIQRPVRTIGPYRYYVGAPDSSTKMPKGWEDWRKPVPSPPGVGEVFTASTKESYVPVVARLAWKLPWGLCQLTSIATGLTSNLSKLSDARQAVEELLEAATQYAVTLSRVLATDELWEDPQWLTAGMSEENLENLREVTRQTLDRLARLTAGPPTKE